MPEAAIRCTCAIDTGPDSDDEERAGLARRLRQELLELSEVEHVESPTAEAAEGSKSPFGAIDYQALIVTLAASGGVPTTLIAAVQALLLHREKRA